MRNKDLTPEQLEKEIHSRRKAAVLEIRDRIHEAGVNNFMVLAEDENKFCAVINELLDYCDSMIEGMK